LLDKYWGIHLQTNVVGQTGNDDEHQYDYTKIREKDLLIRAQETYFEAGHTMDKQEKRKLYLRACDLFEQINKLGYLGFLFTTSNQWEIARQRAGE
jgi:hypothetical protein